MAKKIEGYIKLQVPAGSATPSPPIGPALGQRGVNIMEFCKAFNAATQEMEKGMPIPTVITVYGDRSFTFVTKTAPATYFIKKAANLKSGSKEPGKVSAGYGSSSSQVSIAVFNRIGKVDAQMVPYKGIPLAVNDVLGGVVDFTFVDLGNAIAQSRGGRMRALGITAPKRSPLVADWPALAETLPGFDITAWFAVLGPAGMPREVVDKLHGAIAQVLRSAEAREKLAGIGIQPMALNPSELRAFMASEVSKWIRLVRESNIQPE